MFFGWKEFLIYIMSVTIKHLNPDELFKSPAFSQVITVEGNGRTIYIGGQNAVDRENRLVGKNDLHAQCTQVMKNILEALHSSGASWKDLIKLTIYLRQGEDATQAFEAARPFMTPGVPPPIVTVLYVAGLGNPDYLLEIDGIAVIRVDE